MNTHPNTAKVMLAARLIAEVNNAALLHNTLLHGVIHAAEELQPWIETETNVEEVATAGLIAIDHLKHIEEKAIGVRSTVLDEELLEEFTYRVKRVEQALLQRKEEFRRHMEKMELSEKAKGKDVKTKSISPMDWSRWPKEEEDEEKNDESLLWEAKEKTPDATEKKATPKQNEANHGHDEAASNGTKVTVEAILVSDRQLAHKKARWWCVGLGVILCLVFTLSVVVLLFCQQANYHASWNMRSANVTEDQAQIIRQALNHLGDTLLRYNTSTLTMPHTIASAVLMEMTTRDSAPQDMKFERGSFVTEFRGAVQDFTHQNRVTEVTTARFLGAVCMTNITYPMHPKNDIFAGKDVVMSVLTPNDCINDVGDAGIFNSVIPSYLRYSNLVTTYRGTMARLTTFYQEALGISVAVTHDYRDFEKTMAPQNTRLQKLADVMSTSEELTLKLTQWLVALWVLMMILMAVVLQYMITSTVAHHFCIFPPLIGLLVGIELVACLLLMQYAFGQSTNENFQSEITGVVKSIGSLMLSTTMKEYNLTDVVFDSLSSGLLQGRLFAYNIFTDEVRPAGMQSIANAIDASAISREKRGLYEGVVAGYFVSSTFLYGTEWNYVMVTSVPSAFHWNNSIVVIFVAFFVCTGVTATFLSFTPLRRLRSYAVESYLLRYYIRPSQARWIYYALVVLLSVGGAVGLTVYAIIWFGYTIAVQAATTMGLLAAMLRSEPIQSVCTDNCGMPNFVLTLYFQKVQQPGSAYASGECLTNNLPFPYPSAEQERNMNTGLQLLMDGTQATLINIPSFSTPLVNATQNITYPPHILRHMLSTATLSDSLGFMMERFPTSFSDASLGAVLLTLAVCLLLCLALVTVTVSERWYISLHDRVQEKNTKRSLRLPYVVLAALVMLPVGGFLLLVCLSMMWCRERLIQFSYQELSFMASAIGYRMGLLLLESPLDETMGIEYMEQVADNASTLAQVMGSTFCRVRLLQEYPQRGSGTVRVVHGNNTLPVNLGSVDNRFIPVCGRTEGNALSMSTTKTLQYCYIEVPQHLRTTAAVQPRLFTLVTTQVDSMIDAPLGELVQLNVIMCFVVALMVAGVLWFTLFLTLYTAHHSGYPLFTEEEEVEVTSRTEPLRAHMAPSAFLPRRHRLWWIGSILLLALLILFYCSTMNAIFDQMESSNQLLVAERTQYEEGTSIVQNAVADAYNYIVFPFPQHTLDSLLTLRTSILDGTSDFKFIGSSKKQFTDALLTAYNSLSSLKGGMSASIGAATEGFGSYTSYLASSYASLFIPVQKLFLDGVLSMWDLLETELPALPGLHYQFVIEFASYLTETYDLSVKLFILDHMAVTTSANFGYVRLPFWQFGNPENIVDNAKAAATELMERTSAKIALLKDTLASMTSATTSPLSTTLNELSSLLAVSTAVTIPSSPLWSIQVSRCEEIIAAQNQTLLNIATADETSQLAMIQNLQGNLSDAMNEEIRFRRVTQLVEFIDDRKSLEGIQTVMAWERWLGLTDAKQRFVLTFFFLFLTFVVISVCLLAQWWWMRMCAIRVQEEKEKEVREWERSWMENKEKEDDRSLLGKRQQEGNGEDGWHLGQRKVEEQERIDEGENRIRRPHSICHSEKEEMAFLPFPYHPHSSTASLTSNPASFSFPMKRKVVVMGFFLLLTLVPICCCHAVMLQAQQMCVDNLQDNSLVLALYPKVNSLLSSLEEVQLKLVSFYDNIVSEADIGTFLYSFGSLVKQLELEFVWDTQGKKIVEIEKFGILFDEIASAIRSEINRYLNITSVVDVEDYFTPQTAYARATLQNISNANVYGILLPVSCTTTDSPLSTFLNNIISTAVTEANSINSTETFLQLFQSIEEVCISVQNVATAELYLWDSIVAAAMEDGAPIAVKYGTFEQLVGLTGISAIEDAEDSSAAAAVESIQAYFQELLASYSTSAQQTELFTNSASAPINASASVLAAYQAAGYASSYLTRTNTQGKFSNVFGYNRNLTANSVTEAGKKTLVELMDEFRSSVLELYNAITPGELSYSLASTNTYIWSTQFEVTRKTTSPYQSIPYLQKILWWFCIATFWTLILAVAVGSYFMSLF